ncbi:tubulin polyglutamylase TTLL7 isoform X2 [Spodoptera litura]|uniref:Tubulin polyglutamylase TTLL7 isoform X2 n=1 Tax=Spodoptera litura TaxID=69820 RepID=A0A9J7EA36_SPOLT|nr:tubulin polyglutamylase TTLL7 isoform X2 [Spodoptera litura]
MENDAQKPDEGEEEALNNNIVHKEKHTDDVQKDKEVQIITNKFKRRFENSFTNIFFLVCITGISLGILLEIVNVVRRNQKPEVEIVTEIASSSLNPKYWMYPNTKAVNSRDDFLKHVHVVLERVGYEKSTNETPWDLLWSYPNPFTDINLKKLSGNQKVNHFPGTGFITCKVELATSQSDFIPKAFRLPKDKNDFLKYAENNKDALFVQKHNNHRNVHLKNVTEIDLSNNKTFVQEFIQRPFLVDGHKFDIGVYVVLESVNPLRVYWYKGDILFRFCPTKYYPFDPSNVDKYVIGDDYLPTWEVPSLAHPYTALGNTMKETFDIYARSVGKDTTKMWQDVQAAITEIFIMKESIIDDKFKAYSSPENFFEMMRFDLIVDENLKVYLLEANMGPNLSSKHFPPNQLLYEQVLYNLFSLTGVAQAKVAVNAADKGETKAAEDMVSAEKNIAVYGDECRTLCKDSCEVSDLCRLCKPCLTVKLKKTLLAAYREFLHRGDFRRLIPPPMVPNQDIKAVLEEVKDLSLNNKLLHLWYQGKCNQDLTWCL